jgi:hypothetical protein
MPRRAALHPRHALLGLFVSFMTVACAPIFSDARMVGKGRTEITPGLSGTGITAEGESEHVTNNFGVQALVGVHERVDLGVGYLRSQVVDEDVGVNILEFGPKFSLVRDRVAFALPIGFLFGEDVDTADSWHFYPTALFTVPAGNWVDINPAVRVLIPTCDDCEVLLGFNLGAGIKAGGRTLLRPEFGVLVNPGEDGVVWHFGFAVSIRAGAR